MPTTQTFSDFHMVGGIMVAKKMVMEQSGQKIANVRITETKINSGQTIQQLAMKP
jgi:hypothetical protein